MLFIGMFMFAAVALLCIVVGAVAMKRRRAYENSDGNDDSFDFDAYEGFDKQ
jgi:hypothetical protein